MPERKTIKRAKKDLREGKAPTTAAGEFVREEIEHVRHGKHGARSSKPAIAIGLSKARRAGVPLPPRKGKPAARKSARRPSRRRSRAVTRALKREPRSSASRRALSRQAKRSRRKR